MRGHPNTDRSIPDSFRPDVSPPDVSPWVRRHAGLIPAGSAVLDIACGAGRHTRFLAGRGHRVTATDIDLSGVTDLGDDDRVELIECDLEHSPWPFASRRFGGIVVTNYLFRPLFKHMIAGLAGGGVLIYDTFAAGNERFGRPRNAAFLLQPAELLDAFCADLRIIAYDHGRIDGPKPAVRQRLCAERIPADRRNAGSVRRARCSSIPA